MNLDQLSAVDFVDSKSNFLTKYCLYKRLTILFLFS